MRWGNLDGNVNVNASKVREDTFRTLRYDQQDLSLE